MVMTLNFGNNLFPPRGGITANYSYVDVTNGQGYITFYCATAFDENADEQDVLTVNPSDSVTKSTSATSTGQTYSKKVDKDFDIEIQKSMTLKGIALAEFTAVVSANDNSSGTGAYAVIKLRKYDGSTETDITSGKTDVHKSASDGVIRFLLRMDIDSNTSYKKGDILRVTLEVWAKEAVGGYWVTWETYHDPSSRTVFAKNYEGPSAEDTAYQYPERTDMKVHLPFKIEI